MSKQVEPHGKSPRHLTKRSSGATSRPNADPSTHGERSCPSAAGGRRVALIAGGSGAIGSAIAKRLASDGIRVFVGFHRNHEAAEVGVSKIVAAGGNAETIHLDVNSPFESEEVCEHIFTVCESLDILVNCAAINIEAPALGIEDEAWNRVIDINLTGAFRLCRAAAKYMMLNRWGRIINVSSISSGFGGRGQINYAASKGGLETMTRVLALELGRKGILANWGPFGSGPFGSGLQYCNSAECGQQSPHPLL